MDRQKQIAALEKRIAGTKKYALGKQKSLEIRREGKVIRKVTPQQFIQEAETELKKLRELPKPPKVRKPRKKKTLPPIPQGEVSDSGYSTSASVPATPKPAPARQPPPPQNTGSVNVAQSGVRRVNIIKSRGGGGGGDEPPRRGGDSDSGYSTGSRGKTITIKKQRQKQTRAARGPTKPATGIKQPVKAKGNTKAKVRLGGITKKPVRSVSKPKKPKRDIQKIVVPKAKERVRKAEGTIEKKVGSGRVVKQVEPTRPIARRRVKGEDTAPRGKGVRPTY